MAEIPSPRRKSRSPTAIDRMAKGLAKGDVWDELLQLALRFSRTVKFRTEG